MEHDQVEATLPDYPVSRETTARLSLFTGLLAAWSATLNLIARRDLPRIWERHVLDCLQLAPLLPADGDLIDLGSGAGFPGLVLSIATARHFHLIESDHRKAAFLREAARVCNAGVTVHAMRVQAVMLPPAQCITARALAPLPNLLELAWPLLAPTGTCVLLKGRRAEDELTRAQAEWHMRVHRWRSRTEPDAVVLEISELARHVRHPR